LRGLSLVSGGIGGGGTAFIGEGSSMAEVEEIEERSADAGAPGCENGLPGPFGASAKL